GSKRRLNIIAPPEIDPRCADREQWHGQCDGPADLATADMFRPRADRGRWRTGPRETDRGPPQSALPSVAPAPGAVQQERRFGKARPQGRPGLTKPVWPQEKYGEALTRSISWEARCPRQDGTVPSSG